jgi:hypothetical protein
MIGGGEDGAVRVLRCGQRLAALCAKRDPLDAIDRWCLVELTSTLKNSYRSARIANCERKLCRQVYNVHGTYHLN